MITLEATEGLNRRNFDDHGDHDFDGTCEPGSKFLATVDEHALMSRLLGGFDDPPKRDLSHGLDDHMDFCGCHHHQQ